MNNRWKMNRLGLINFWLYDEEIFQFEDGKLLLRGQNGSGKSITTQSFIPFILDGDRTPSRLDPFGSSDRRMEYYFLGEEERDEATGYLFLEFKKEGTEQYRTIGIGQRAKRGAPMGFWGFVLTDGRRIGYDIQLYKEVRSTKIPYSKQDLKKVLGPDTPFTDMPGEYKSLVNKYIFGFPRLEQYDQFIRLLVKVRAPKLSKEFKPTKVYEILNESLQTLTNEDLRAMVDAMEKMDSIQNSLEHLQEAYRDVKIIQNEYTRYNQFMLAQKAKAYLDEKSRVEEMQNKLENDNLTICKLETEKTEKKSEQEEKTQRQRAIEVELSVLRENNLDATVQKLEANRKSEADLKEQNTKKKLQIDQTKEKLLEADCKIREYGNAADFFREELAESREILEDYQETLQFSAHEDVMRMLQYGDRFQRSEIMAEDMPNGADRIKEFQAAVKKTESQIRELLDGIRAGKHAIDVHEEAEKRYDRAAEETAHALAEKQARDDELKGLEQEEENARDLWIEAFYQCAEDNQELILEKRELTLLEQEITSYQGVIEATKIRKILEDCREERRKELRETQETTEKEERLKKEILGKKQAELEALLEIEDWEPERREMTVASRKALEEAGISAIPFYQAVEFSPKLNQEERNLLEVQLRDSGILDALITNPGDWERIESEFPEFTDVVIRVSDESENVPFDKLTVSNELDDVLRKETLRILKHISEDCNKKTGLLLNENGFFQNGILKGRSKADSPAVFIGALERKQRLAKEIECVKNEIAEIEYDLSELAKRLNELNNRFMKLEQEYEELPDSAELDQILEKKKECLWYLELEKKRLENAEKVEQALAEERKRCFQQVIQNCRNLPYLRTSAGYQEAENAGTDYVETWKKALAELRSLNQQMELLENEKKNQEQMEEYLDDAIYESSHIENELALLAIAIREAEEFLNRPENRELAQRLEKLRNELQVLQKRIKENEDRLLLINHELERILDGLEQKKTELTERIRLETKLREYFEEELSLKLVLSREEKTLIQCAKESLQQLRESDRNRNPSELTTSLYQVFQKYSSSLVRYATTLEDCFSEETGDAAILRKRQRITSVWNGKKLYFSAFSQMLKNSIEETELLIQQKDRELFEDILSRTLSQQLTERIAESREWIKQMSSLMKGMDTSMGLSFSLEWKAKSAESAQELDTSELEKLLMRDRKLLTIEDVEKVATHFRSKIRIEKQRVEENNGVVNYMDLVRDALDYRKWFAFQMFYYRNQDGRKPLTNAAFNKFSGGEKAMAMYVPLFAAVNAQYQKCRKTDYPRMIALDEAFAGVDEKNISSMFKLVETLDFDYIMNSQAIWGCYDTVPALKISELHRPLDSRIVTAIHYTWNGHERELDEQ